MEAFRRSEFIAQIFGKEFQAHYLLSRDAEQQAFDGWMSSRITDFEFQRYFIGT